MNNAFNPLGDLYKQQKEEFERERERDQLGLP